ncbi:uncharacterized protein LOC141908456 [Tubulanus polymorphus]|uniref:uncharacterized protein LOC141908456 n=1 Tax=Tubulanus polymorphus TaxID=672921 RepID=UPI003DA6798B
MGEDCCFRKLGCCHQRCPCVAVVAAIINMIAVACVAVAIFYIKNKLEILFNLEFTLIAVAAICATMGVYDVWTCIASLCLANGGCFFVSCCECFCVIRNLVVGFLLNIAWLGLFGISVLVGLTFWTVKRLCLTGTQNDVCAHLTKSGFRNFSQIECDQLALCNRTDVSYISGLSIAAGSFASCVSLLIIAMAFSANYVFWRNDLGDNDGGGDYEMIYKSNPNRYDVDAKDSPAFSTNRRV